MNKGFSKNHAESNSSYDKLVETVNDANLIVRIRSLRFGFYEIIVSAISGLFSSTVIGK